MAVDISKWPLLVLMESFNQWIASARSSDFWDPQADHQYRAESLRTEAKEVIVWLEIKGLDEAAFQLEQSVVAFRGAAWDLQHACQSTYGPEDDHCRALAAALIEEAESVAGVCEDLDQEVPRGAWEGFQGD